MQFSFFPAADNYLTIAAPAEAEYKDKNSRFIACAMEVENEQDIKDGLERVRKLYPKATHYCYAYRLGLDSNNYRANDDGEPSGTAGRPILGQIDSAQLTNVLIVVVRYYGGVNLGVSGLKEAYKTSSKLALQSAEKVEKLVKKRFLLSFQYAQMPDMMNFLKANQVEILENNFVDIANLTVQVRAGFVQQLLDFVQSLPDTTAVAVLD